MKKAMWMLASALALFAGPALAQPVPSVANTSQKGSLLIFPEITSRFATTLIEISNDQAYTVHVKCYYVNEKKGRNDFSFEISGNGTVSWDVLTLAGDHVNPNVFPTGGSFGPPGFAPTSNLRGALICFAVSADGRYQVAFNHLYGTATVVTKGASTLRQWRYAKRYNAWSFKAWAEPGVPADDNTPVGPAGYLPLTGAPYVDTTPASNHSTSYFYDACPRFNTTPFMPRGAALAFVKTLDNELVGVGCYQDLRQDYKLHLTKLQFTVWNSNENNFTGAYICVDSVFSTRLGNRAPYLAEPQNFEYSTLQTPNARFNVRGVASSQCPYYPPTEEVGLLTVLDSAVTLKFHRFTNFKDQDIGNTLIGTGAYPGFVKWDPKPPVSPFLKTAK